MKNNFTNNIIAMERSVRLCGGAPRGDELPQVETLDDVLASLIHDSTGKPLSEIDAIMPKHNSPTRTSRGY